MGRGEYYYDNPGSADDRSVLSLVLGLLGVTVCWITAPFAWYFGAKTLSGMRDGYIPDNNWKTAKAGMILGIVGSVVAVVGIIIVVAIL